MASPWLLAGAGLAVLALVGLTWLLRFRQPPMLASTDEAREQMRCAPGGFEPVAIALDQQGRSAIGRDAEGRLAALFPHGSRFVPRLVKPGWRPVQENGLLFLELEDRRFTIDLGAAAADWIDADINVN